MKGLSKSEQEIVYPTIHFPGLPLKFCIDGLQ
jgi:hypothetical protein